MSGIRSLWHITHLYNIGTILKYGLLSRNLCKQLSIDFFDISDKEVQLRRSEFHGFVPFYFADNTPMLYKVFEEKGDNIILLESNPGVIVKYANVRFSDSNVATINPRIFSDVAELVKLDWSIINSRENISYSYWTQDMKRKKMAEVLVPDRVDISEIQAIHVASQLAYDSVERVVTDAGLEIEIFIDLTKTGVG